MQFDSVIKLIPKNVSTDWTIRPKEIGRNEGCIITSAQETFYIKKQPLCLQTMFVYHLLQRIGCGPSQIYFSAVGSQVCIATREISGFEMSSSSHTKLKMPVEEAMLMVLIVSLFKLGDIPSNNDNWGIQASSMRLSIVDFSFAFTPEVTLMGEKLFVKAYEEFSVIRKEFNLDRKQFLASYAKFFGSQKEFAALIDKTMDDVCMWVNDYKMQQEWRETIGLRGSFTLLNQLNSYRESINRLFFVFSDWFYR